MRKGITPIIAIILLLLITISMVGFAFVWFSRVASISAERAENQTVEQFAAQEKKIRIDNAKATSVTLRNIGSRAVRISELAAFVDDVSTTLSGAGCTAADAISPGATLSCTLGSSCDNPEKLKITAPGNQDVVICK
ncbi:MAG: hypothetical protein HY368_02655 [Candidatus Aenigmarchaeota archaeon]|nr:hypothetical protein [Candidatus Aenigmarchaeota archaeon]